MRSIKRPWSHQSGFSLIEVLITLIILAIGLMGLAGLQSRMLNAEFESYQRSQALMLVEDMVSRIRSNPAAARTSSYSGNAVYGTGNVLGDDACDPANTTTFDLCSWSAALKGASVALNDADETQVGAMIGARGCIETVSGSATSEVVIRVTVAWEGLSPTVAPSLACAQGSFGADDNMRRVASVLVTLAYLGG